MLLTLEDPLSTFSNGLEPGIGPVKLDGRVNLKIPPETQSGKLFRLRGKGVTPVRGGGVGDLLCKVVVETPVNLTDRQKELLREFQASVSDGGEKHSPKESSWFKGVKDFFDGLTG